MVNSISVEAFATTHEEMFVTWTYSNRPILEYRNNGNLISSVETYIDESLAGSGYTGGNAASNVNEIVLCRYDYFVDFVYLPEAYDYYLVSRIWCQTTPDNFTFKPNGTASILKNTGNEMVQMETKYYMFQSGNVSGFQTVSKLPDDLTDTAINGFSFYGEHGSVGPTLHALMYIVPVVKTNSDESQAILEHLQQIEDNTNNIEQGLKDVQKTLEEQYGVEDNEDFGVGELTEDTEQKMGALTFASDTMIGMLDLFDADDVGEAKFTFPSFSIKVQGETYKIWDDIEFNFVILEEHFGVLIEAVRWAMTMLVYVALIQYIGKSYNDIIGGY